MIRSGFFSWMGLVAVAACQPLLLLPARAQVSTPAAGVVCDQRARLCYARQGISLPLTQQYFGEIQAQSLRNQLRLNPAPTEFRLSNGVACSPAQRLCWRDSWGRRQVDRALTQQLYGGDGSAPNTTNRTDQTDAGFCQLYRRDQRLFSGSCTLRKVSHADKNRTRFDATLGNGSGYSFLQRDGVTVIQDASGNSWPVSASVQGCTVTFRWSDMQLMTTRSDSVSAGAGGAPGSTVTEALGSGLINLLNSLFR
jgi:hypothetical protein